MDEFVVVDVETTGLSPEKNEILEVCAIKFNGNGNTLDVFHKYCYPLSGFIPEEVSNIHGITMEKVKNEKPYGDIRSSLAEFIGERTLIGHNIIGFDIKFLKIHPVKIEDTLVMCRSRWGARNKLELTCKRMKIDFNPDDAHTAEYDAKKTGLLYIALKNLEENESIKTSLFDNKLDATQTYSLSRIKMFQTCPYKWHQAYVLKNKEPNRSYFVVGRVVHKICEMSAIWCYAESFSQKLFMYANDNNINLLSNSDLLREVDDEIAKNVFNLPGGVITQRHIGMYLYSNPTALKKYFNLKRYDLQHINNDGCIKPGYDTYRKFVMRAIGNEKCSDASIIKEIEILSSMFYNNCDFSLNKGEAAIIEKKLCFNKNWELKDWFDNNAYFRGIIDLMECSSDGRTITITDYKTSRVMLNANELSSDLQMKLYIMLAMVFMNNEIDVIKIRHHYIRYNKIIEHVIDNPGEIASDAKEWLIGAIDEIERELLKGKFKPERNEYCSSCYIGDKCPLFQGGEAADEIMDNGDLLKSWKKIESNRVESAKLMSMCKKYVKGTEAVILVDKVASLDYWVKETKSYDPLKLARLLMSKDVDLKNMIPYFGISETNLEKLKKGLSVDISDEEIDLMTNKSTKTTFAALTPEESHGYLNLRNS